MNYYKQGDAANADKIKAAFESKGIYSKLNFANENYLYYSCDGTVAFCFNGGGLANIIKTHPDYKELELPVEPKFKVGDRVIYDGKVRTITFMDENFYDFDGGVAGCRIEKQDELKPASNYKKGDLLVHNNDPTCRVLVVDVSEKYGYQLQGGGSRYHLSFTTVEKEYHLWTIADANDGDVLVTEDYIFIFKYILHGGVHLYCHYNIDDEEFDSDIPDAIIGNFHDKGAHFQPATQKQRDLLFKKMAEAGYQWDADKKELRKVQPHYDIANFKPFDKVLVRDGNNETWRISFYGYYNKEAHYSHFVGTCWSKQCIPFDGNEHLLGTTDKPSEEFINW